MNDQSQTINPDIQAYKRLLVDLHRLIADGKSDSEEADDIRDRLLDIWRRLSDDEIAWLDGLSADLFMLQNDEVFEPSDWPLDRLQSEVLQAHEENDWNRVLTLLRKGTSLPADELANLRSLCYANLGHPDISILFDRQACTLSPTNPIYRLGLVQDHLAAGQALEAMNQAERFVSDLPDQSHGLALVLPALLYAARGLSPEQARSWAGRTASLAEGIVNEIRRQDTRVDKSRYYMPALFSLGFSLKLMDRLDEARCVFDEMIELDPTDTLASTMRGMIVYPRDRESAARDFEAAALPDAPIPEPYRLLTEYIAQTPRPDRSSLPLSA